MKLSRKEFIQLGALASGIAAAAEAKEVGDMTEAEFAQHQAKRREELAAAVDIVVVAGYQYDGTLQSVARGELGEVM